MKNDNYVFKFSGAKWSMELIELCVAFNDLYRIKWKLDKKKSNA